ncbi:MAG: TonB-dependent receptor [Chlorobi bacterium]|nr:MAG: TonB-dependent receptor [Bacteroidota bacterium]KXK35278.1 MAG: TonB-dependent receptor plug [Chlorobi bacterium OLB6]MBE2264915.1 TonB-dependent receptor [Flavobacteriales bacterium]MBL1160588.1 TonB-dependent receptor [Chlorobiota bacterium]MBW7853164.1 TonB-dependent receptor [Candidatus Kapabacteria bacterium]MCC6331347.1 TonB-dependent receptor [Ignavibacteria bacterium]
MFFLYIVLVLLSAVTASAVDLYGTITNRTSGQPVVAATVRIHGLQKGAVTDTAGKFKIAGLPTGVFSLVASRIGYKPSTITITLTDNTEHVVLTMLEASIVKQDVIVSASRRVQAVQDVPISVSTLNSSDVAERSITRLDDALRYVSGVSVVKDQVNIRGSSGFALGVGNRTMVLLDGFPLMSGDNGDIKFDVMPVSDIGRIEIIKGAGSALYGTGALGGVVTMFTAKPPAGTTITGRGFAGTYSKPRYSEWNYRASAPLSSGLDIRLTHSTPEITVSGSAAIRSDEGYRDFDKSLDGIAFGKFQWNLGANNHLTAFALYATHTGENFLYWKDLRYATFPPDAQDREQLLRSGKLAGGLEWAAFLDNRTTLTVRAGIFRTEFGNLINNVMQDSNHSVANSWNTDILATRVFSDQFTLTGGLNAKLNSVSADVYGEQFQALAAGFVQGEFSFTNGPILTLGVRLDHEKTATLPSYLELSPKFGISWHVTPSVALRASIGRGFRAPAIAERYANIRYGPFNVIPNPNLLAESSVSYEAGMHYTPEDAVLPVDIDIAVFNNELYDLIEPTFAMDDPSVPIIFQNVTRARILGAECTVRAILHPRLTAETGITGMLPTDLLTGQTLKYRNNVLWYSRAEYSITNRLQVGIDYRFQNKVEQVDDKLDAFIPNATARVPVHIVDARILYTVDIGIQQQLRLGVIGKNILDYYYAEAVANLSPTRQLLFQIEVLQP